MYLSKSFQTIALMLLAAALGAAVALENPYLNGASAAMAVLIGAMVVGGLEAFTFGQPPFGSRAQRALVSCIPGMAIGITASVIQHWGAGIVVFQLSSIPDWLVWPFMFTLVGALSSAIAPRNHMRDYWLIKEMDFILQLNLDERGLITIARALHDRNPLVRKAAADFFLWRARQGRPVPLALNDLVAALLEDASRFRDPGRTANTMRDLEEMVSDANFTTTTSLAIGATIGAKRLYIGWEHPNLDEFRNLCRRAALESEFMDAEEREDAHLYLRHLFNEALDKDT